MSISHPGQKIDLPLPPELAEALGYLGDARFVAFYWAYDDLVFSDGRSSGTAQGWTFQAYARHRAVAPLLDRHDLGGSDHEAPYVLLIDRERNRATIAGAVQAKSFLKTRWPAEPPLTPEQQEAVRREMDAVLEEWRTRPVDHAAVAKAMAEQRGRVGRMMSWLDMCPVPAEGRSP